MVPKEIMESVQARKASYEAIKKNQSEILSQINRLIPLGYYVIFGILGVSILHLYHIISMAIPTPVPNLLPVWAHLTSALLFTISIDVTLFYLLIAWNTSSYGGVDSSRGFRLWARWFFYLLTGLLNTTFVLTYMPEVSQFFWVENLRGILAIANSFLLGILVPLSLGAVELAVTDLRYSKTVITTQIAALAAGLSEIVQEEPVPLPPILSGEPISPSFSSPIASPNSNNARIYRFD